MRVSINGRSTLAVLLLFSLCGCDSGRFVTVSGNVKINGQPAKGVELEFEPVSLGHPGGGGYTNEQGDYDIAISRTYRGLMPGDYIIRVRGENEQPRSEDAPPITHPKFPPEYHRRNTKVVTVTSSSNVFNFDVITKDK